MRIQPIHVSSLKSPEEYCLSETIDDAKSTVNSKPKPIPKLQFLIQAVQFCATKLRGKLREQIQVLQWMSDVRQTILPKQHCLLRVLAWATFLLASVTHYL